MNHGEKGKNPNAAVFAGVQAIRGLNQRSATRAVLLNDLINYINGHEGIDDAWIRQALNSNLTLRRQFNQLLASKRVGFDQVQAQADSGELVQERVAETFTLKFKLSRANTKQVYVLLKVSPEACLAESHKPVLIVEKSDVVERICFPELCDGIAQTLLESDDQRLILLRDPEAEISLV